MTRRDDWWHRPDRWERVEQLFYSGLITCIVLVHVAGVLYLLLCVLTAKGMGW